MISIIVPVYNAEKHLDKCLRSIIAQTYKEIEIIIVNDGSTDDSSIIIERYCSIDNRIKVITQKNSGLSAARNNGLEFVTKEYVMFVDSDDFIEENTCEQLSKYIEKDKSDVYIFGLYYDYGNKKDIGSQNLQYKKYDDGKKYMEISLGEGNFRTFAHSKMFKNNLLEADTFTHSERIRFVNGLLYEDMLFIVQVFCKAKSVSVVPEYFYHYVQHYSGRITVQYKKQDLDVLTFIGMLNNNYYKTGEINNFIYAVLVFRWVSSCLIYKYIKRYFFSKQAREMINTVIKNESFREAVRLCTTENGIPKRDIYLTKLLNINQFMYKIIVFSLVLVKRFL